MIDLLNNMWILVGFFLSIMVLTYLIGDNGLYRLAIHLFIGVTAGYAAVMICYQVILPKLILPIMWGGPEIYWVIIPWLLSLLLLMRLFPKVSRAGNVPLAFMVGVASAVIISSALMGTLATQISSVINLFDFNWTQPGWFWTFIEGVYVLLGTLSTLLYFQFFTPKEQPGKTNLQSKAFKSIRLVGQVFLSMTLGALFAGAYLTALMAVIARVDDLSIVFWSLFSN
ncbi:MAG: hypothetical protein V2J07_07855 [Anaerolineae bacterium]|jgi:hypothetical protein|nr:hypothetical protein [Anaerolineae bacterium]